MPYRKGSACPVDCVTAPIADCATSNYSTTNVNIAPPKPTRRESRKSEKGVGNRDICEFPGKHPPLVDASCCSPGVSWAHSMFTWLGVGQPARSPNTLPNCAEQACCITTRSAIAQSFAQGPSGLNRQPASRAPRNLIPSENHGQSMASHIALVQLSESH